MDIASKKTHNRQSPLLTDTDEFQVESYRAMGIKIDGGHVALNAKAAGAALNQQIEAEYRSLYEISAVLTRWTGIWTDGIKR